MPVFIVALLVFILWYSKKVYKSYFSHLSIFVGVNAGAIILMYGCSIIDSSLSSTTWVCIWVMFGGFLLGSLVGKYKFSLCKKYNGKEQICKISNIARLRKLIIVYSIVYNIFAFYYFFRLNSYYGIGRMFVDMSGINLAFQNGDFTRGLSSYFTPIGISLSLMILYYIKKVKGNSLLYIQYALCYIQCISPRRDNLFFMIVMTLLFIVSQNYKNIKLSNRTKKNVKRVVIVFVIFVVAVWIMSFTQNLMNKSSSVDFTVFGFKVPEFMKDACLYAAGNYPYLDRMLQINDLNISFPLIATLRLFYRYICGPLGFEIDTVTPFDLDFLNIGTSGSLTFNTAPILYYFIIEAGVFFVFIVFVMGFLSKKADDVLRNSESIGLIMLALMQFDIILFSFRSYNLLYLSYILAIFYMLIAHIYIDVDYKKKE